MKKTTGGVTTHFVYDEAGHLIGEYDGSGALIQETVWMEDIPVATLRSNGGSVSIFYVHTDHLNTPRRISRPSDDVIVWRWDSDPFGTDAANQDPDGDTTHLAYNLRFPGQYFDAETELSYNYFRDYDPATGRYPQSDPIGLRAGVNTYAYVRGNPISRSDPLGLNDDAIPVPIPVPLPPVFIPGTKENQDFVDAWTQAIEAIRDAAKNTAEKIRDLCFDEAVDCDQVLRDCRKKCLDIFVDDPEGLPGMGSDYFGRQRRCIRECMEDNQCYDF